MGDLVTHGANKTQYVVSDIRQATTETPLWDMRLLVGGGSLVPVSLTDIGQWPVEARCGQWKHLY